MKLVEAEEAMGEDDGIPWGFCIDLDGAWQKREQCDGDTRYLARILAYSSFIVGPRSDTRGSWDSWRRADAVKYRILVAENRLLEQHLLVAKEIECAIRG